MRSPSRSIDASLVSPASKLILTHGRTFLLLLTYTAKKQRKIRGVGVRRHPQRCPPLHERSTRAGARAGLRPPHRGRDTARREGAHEPDRVAKEMDRQHGEGQTGDGGVRHRCVLGVRSLTGVILYLGGGEERERARATINDDVGGRGGAASASSTTRRRDEKGV